MSLPMFASILGIGIGVFLVAYQMYQYGSQQQNSYGHGGGGGSYHSRPSPPPSSTASNSGCRRRSSTRDDEKTDCRICIEPMNSDNMSITRCCHKFHTNCLNIWIGLSNACPICRTSLK